MKALSIIQPWAEAIVRLGKDVENRTWVPPSSILGQVIAIHASRKWDRECQDNLALVRTLAGSVPMRSEADIKADCGCIVGTARVVGWVQDISDQTERKMAGLERYLPELHRADASRWNFGPVGIVLAEVIALPRPVPIKGALGFWTVPEHAAVVDQLMELRAAHGLEAS